MDCHGDEGTIHLFITVDHVTALCFLFGNVFSSPTQVIGKGFGLNHSLEILSATGCWLLLRILAAF